MSSLSRTVAPTLQPVSLEEVYAHVRVADRSADTLALLNRLIDTAARLAEEITRRALLTQTWQLKLDAFPPSEILLPRPPLQSVTAIQYVDTSGETQTLGAEVYTVDTAHDPGRVLLAASQTWPAIRGEPNDVTITYVAGWTAAASVPQTIRHAILMLVHHWYDFPTEVITGTIVNRVPWAAENLLLMERCYGIET